jgi:protein required for attachment to host cells
MKVPHNALVAIVDGERFKLMRNTGPMFEPKLEFVAEPSFRMPVPGAESRSDDRGTLTTAGSQTDLAEVAHGAAVVEWLNAKALHGEIDQLVVVADPRTLGEMRPQYHKALQTRIVAELAKELTWESPQAIAETLAAA